MNHDIHNHHDHTSDPSDTGTGDLESAPGFHGQLVVGEQTVYLSHLPMFMSPHDYQVILEVTLSQPGADPQTEYVANHKTSGETVYTMAPERFDLTGLVLPDAQHARVRSLKGDVFRGHFEQGGEAILPGVEAKVANVVYFERFKPDGQPLTQLTYLLFGKGQELFLAHVISRPPDFDHFLSVKASDPAFSDEELRNGMRIFFPRRANRAADRLKPSKSVRGEGPKGQVALDIGEEIFFNDGTDLQ